MPRIIIAFVGVVISFAAIFAQDNAGDDELVFKEGIFINFRQVLKNSPIEKSRIVSLVNYDDPDFFSNILLQQQLSYFDENGMKQAIEVRKIWGYSKNGVLYVNYNDQFNKVSYLGTICHFIVPNYHKDYETMYDPYSYNSYPYYGNTVRASSQRTELRQFIIDFKTGRIIDFTADNVLALLADDHELYDEYAGLKKKKREQVKFFYIRKYNKRNPIKIPEL